MSRKHRSAARRVDGVARLAPAESDIQGSGLIDKAADRIRCGKWKEAEALAKKAAKAQPGDPTAHLLVGLASIRQGKAKAARGPLERALSLDPANAEANFQMGTVWRTLGDRDKAADCFARALNAKPDFAEAYQQLGMLMHEVGILDQAMQCFALAIQFNPRDANSHFHLGLIQKAQGLAQEALESYARAVSADPRHAAAHVNLGNIALQHGKLEAARSSYRKAVEADPAMAEAHSNLGKVLKDLGRVEEAVAACTTAVKLNPNSYDVQNNLGNALKEAGDLDGAVRSYRRAIRIAPENAVAHYNFGDALHLLRRYEDALEAYDKALRLDPRLARAYNNKGLVVSELGRRDEALGLFRKAVEIEPEHPGYRFSLSRALWDSGDRDGAWALADLGFLCGQRGPNRKFSIPRWDGGSLAGKRLLVWREQGVGDEIKFAMQYGQAVAAAQHCIIEADPRLVPVLQRSFPAAEVRPESTVEEVQDYDADCHVPAGSLLQHFPDEYAVFADGPSYLAPEPALAGTWRERLARLGPGVRIGICWRSGLSGRLRDPHYSTLEDWAAVFAVPGLQFVNLQYGACEEELRAAEEAHAVRIHRWDDLDLKDDLDEVFALTAGLDLVLSAPTAVAEIGVSLGVPTWILQANAAAPGAPPEAWRMESLAAGPAGAYTSRVRWCRHVSEPWADLLARTGALLSVCGGAGFPRRTSGSDDSIAGLRKFIELESGFVMAHDDLAAALSAKAESLMQAGADPAAAELLREAVELLPEWASRAYRRRLSEIVAATAADSC